jgi:hypothetical protein
LVGIQGIPGLSGQLIHQVCWHLTTVKPTVGGD